MHHITDISVQAHFRWTLSQCYMQTVVGNERLLLRFLDDVIEG